MLLSDEQRENEGEVVERRTMLRREEDHYLIERTIRRDEVSSVKLNVLDLFSCITRPIIVLLFASELLVAYCTVYLCSS